MFRVIFLMCALMALSACSSGGSSGGSNGPSNNEPARKPLAVDAGPDQVVFAGERVDITSSVVVTNAGAGSTLSGPSINITIGTGEFQVVGTSSNPSDIVRLRWTRLEGPSFSIYRSDATTGNFWFTAPAADVGKPVDIVYQLTLTNAAGESVSDTITITVIHPNDSNFGASSSSASSSGSTSNTTSSSSSNSGGTSNVTSSSSSSGSVVPTDLPSVRIRYPSPTGVTWEETISVSGYATPQGEEKIKKVEIHIGSAVYPAEIIGGSYWSVDDVPIPTRGESFEILVIAEDSLGRIGSTKSKIMKSGSIVSDLVWGNIIGLHIDAWTGDILALTDSGTADKAISLVSLKQDSEKDDQVIYSFEPQLPNSLSQGNVSSTYHFSDGKFYVGYHESSSNPGVRLYSIDLKGNREQLYPSAASGEVELESISGMVVDGEGTMVLADGITGNIIRVDGKTRAFSLYGKDLFPVDEVNYLALAFDPFSTLYSTYIVPNYKGTPIYGVSSKAEELEIVAGPFIDGKSPAKRIIVSESLAIAFLLDFEGDVYMVSLKNNERMLYMEGPVGEIAYDVLDEILYLYYTDTKSIVMVDIFTGDLVEVTSSK